jgi:exopolysaccharide biosynthesis polyprenyl glycosylphosphotransferase
MLRRFSTQRIFGFFLIDWIGTLAMLFAAALLRAELGNLPQPVLNLINQLKIPEGGRWVDWAIVRPWDILPIQVFVLVALIWPFFFLVFSIYDGRRQDTLKTELLNVFLAICVSTMTLAGVLYFTYRETPRVVILIFLALDISLLLGSRAALWVYRNNQNGHRRRAQRRAVLIVGAGPVGRSAVKELQKHAWADIDIVGYVDDDPDKQDQSFEDIPVIGVLEQVPEIVQSLRIRDAIVALPLRAHEQLVEICSKLQKLSVRVHVIPDLFALSFPSAELEGFGGIPVIDLGRPGIFGWQRFFKRMFDAAATTLGLLLLTPLLLAVTALIKLDSPGPVIFRQLRIGENGQPFTMFKFRSMHMDADPEVHKVYVKRIIEQNTDLERAHRDGQHSLKMAGDPRVTRIGRIIRKTSIDELPQLFNVLRGEMSLVGPRPPVYYELEAYKEWHRRRFEVPPGITGWWQVNGRSRVSFDEMIRMDLYYIDHRSFWLDLKILFLTPWAVISGKGAG